MAKPRAEFIVSVDDQTKRDLSAIEKRFQKLGKAAGVTLAAGVTSAAGALSVLAKNSLDSAKEVRNLSVVAGTSVRTLSRLGFAAESAGISTEKLADIYKDTGDKIGDFIQTGGGPLKDFFDTVGKAAGVTADQFRDLAGPDALQLYFSTLEKANLSSSEMTFYLEAIANDASRLTPLLRDNGKEFERLAASSDKLGNTLDKDLVRRARQVDEALELAKGSLAGVGNSLVRTFSPNIVAAANNIASFVTKTLDAAEALGILRARSDEGRLLQIDKEINNNAEALKNLSRQYRTLHELDGSRVAIAQLLNETNAESLALLKEKAEIEERLASTVQPQLSDNSQGTVSVIGGVTNEAIENSLLLLEDYYERRFGIDEFYRQQDLALHRKHELELSKITNKEEKDRVKAKQAAEKAKVDKTRKFFAQGFNDLAKNSKKAFQIQKAYRIAEAVQNTYSAAIGAYQALAPIPIVGPALGAAAAAAAVAFGAAQVNQIKSSKPGGGGGVSAGAPAAVSASASGPSASDSVSLSEATQQQATNVISIDFAGGITDSNAVREFIENDFAEALRDGSGLDVQVIAK